MILDSQPQDDRSALDLVPGTSLSSVGEIGFHIDGLKGLRHDPIEEVHIMHIPAGDADKCGIVAAERVKELPRRIR